MTRDDIIRMAREAGLTIAFTEPYEDGWQELQEFADFVAAAEREACAKIAETYEPRCDTCPSGVSTAIRARGA
jgi:hypothetical protein